MIHSVQIMNFKSLRRVHVKLSPLTVLIGRSGTGKSNFIQALRFVRDYLRGGEQAAIGPHRGGWRAVLCDTRSKSDKLAFELHFDVPGSPGVFRYLLAFKIEGSQISFHTEVLQVDDRELYGQVDGKWTRRPDVVSVPDPGQVVIGKLYELTEARIAHIVLKQSIGCYDFPGSVCTGPWQEANQGMEDNGQNYLGVFDRIATDLAGYSLVGEMETALRRLNASLKSINLSDDRQSLSVIHRIGEQALGIDLHQESDGFRRFLAHLLALYQQPSKRTVTFEEPENGIFPGALSVLADTFQAAAAEVRSQVILTTHSPQLLQHFSHDQIRVVEIEDRATKIGAIAPEQRESIEEKLMTTDELLTADEARLDESKA